MYLRLFSNISKNPMSQERANNERRLFSLGASNKGAVCLTACFIVCSIYFYNWLLRVHLKPRETPEQIASKWQKQGCNFLSCLSLSGWLLESICGESFVKEKLVFDHREIWWRCCHGLSQSLDSVFSIFLLLYNNIPEALDWGCAALMKLCWSEIFLHGF